MNTTTYHPVYNHEKTENHSGSIVTSFFQWSEKEEKNRIAWLGVSVMLMTAIFFPVTMVAILIHGGSFKLIIGAMFSLILVVIPNLAALPTKYTIPAFFAGMVLDIFLVVASFFI
jgi:hypothetical protein